MKRWIRVFVPILVVAFLAPAAMATGQEPVQAPERRDGRAGATVSVDRFNYKPGDTAAIKGAGFLPGELVKVQVVHANGQNEGEAHLPFTIVSDGEGRIADQWIVPTTETGNRVFALTAEGLSSGEVALSSLTATEIFLIDDQGADDYPGQKDLNYFTFDYGLPGATSITLTWGWDDTAWSGNNSGDACVLFDTDADGKANFAYCVTVKGTPAAFSSSRLYSCGDTRSDRCSQNTPITDFTSTASASVVAGADPFGNAGPYFTASHTSGNTCGATSGCYTADTVAAVVAQLADFGGASAKLLNVCSYPSAEPNSAPSECVVTPNNGFLTIKKVAPTDDATQFTFNIGAGQQSQSGATSWNITGNGQVTFISFPAGTTYDLSEVVPQGYALSGASCALQTAPPTATGTFASPTVSNFTIQSGLETICTFTNGVVPGTLIVRKTVVNDNGGTKIATNFSFQVNGGSVTSFLQDGANTLAGRNTITVQPGTYSVTEPAVAGYETTYSNCTNVVIAAGGTATCIITNSDSKAGPAGSTVQRSVLHDQITITGIRAGASDAASATAIFRLYSNAACTTLAGSETRSLSYNGAGTEATSTTTAGVLVSLGGTYRWTVQYSGDSFNTGFTTACGEETTAVTFVQ